MILHILFLEISNPFLTSELSLAIKKRYTRHVTLLSSFDTNNRVYVYKKYNTHFINARMQFDNGNVKYIFETLSQTLIVTPCRKNAQNTTCLFISNNQCIMRANEFIEVHFVLLSCLISIEFKSLMLLSIHYVDT